MRLASTTFFHSSKGKILERHGRGAGAGIVEEEIEPAEGFLGGGEERLHLRGVADIGDDGKGLGAQPLPHLRGLLQSVLAPSGEGHGIAVLHQRHRDGAADTASRAGNDGRFVNGGHGILPLALDRGRC